MTTCSQCGSGQWPQNRAHLANRKLNGIGAALLRGRGGGGGRTLAATPSLSLGTAHNRRAKVLRICEWEVV